MKIISTTLSRQELEEAAKNRFGDMVKCVVDLEKRIMAIGESMHADEEMILIENGSQQNNLWGINIYIPYSGRESIEFDSMINIRPGQGNRSRSVEDPEIRERIYQFLETIITN